MTALILALVTAFTPAPAPGCWDGGWRCHDLTRARGTALDQTGWLQRDAKVWAARMAERRSIFHAPPPGWGPYGENVGVGTDWRTVLAAFMASPPHRANITDPHYSRVGIGVARADGRVYVVIRFH